VAFHPVFSEFLSTLVSNRVRFLVVGAHALAVHGRPRYTDDLDVWVEPTPANAKRVIRALSEFGYDAYALHESEFCTPDRMTQLGKPPLRIDVMTSVSGVRFDEAWAHRVRARIEGLSVSFIGRREFAKNKAASGRAKDLADLALLDEAEHTRGARAPKRKAKARKKR
jgi:hypothetical protein